MTKKNQSFMLGQGRSVIVKCTCPPSPGHAFSVQISVSSSGPSCSQLNPPFFGSGLLHSRLLIREPLPHVTEQSLQLPQSEYPPWTAVSELDQSKNTRKGTTLNTMPFFSVAQLLLFYSLLYPLFSLRFTSMVNFTGFYPEDNWFFIISLNRVKVEIIQVTQTVTWHSSPYSKTRSKAK